MQHFYQPYFSKCLPVDIFLTSLSISLHTHILQRMLKDNNSKNNTISLYISEGDLFIMWQLAPSSSYQNYFFILSWCGWLSYIHTSKLQYNYMCHLKNHWAFLPPQFLEETKNIMGPTSWSSKSWSQTPWSWSFQQHILPGFPMTIHQPSTLQDTTWSDWGISKNSTTISP